MGLCGKVGAAGFPFPGDLHEDSGNEAEDGRFFGEEAGDAAAALDLPVDRFAPVGSAKAPATAHAKSSPPAVSMLSMRRR